MPGVEKTHLGVGRNRAGQDCGQHVGTARECVTVWGKDLPRPRAEARIGVVAEFLEQRQEGSDPVSAAWSRTGQARMRTTTKL